MTDSDVKLKRDLAHQRKMLALADKQGHEWSAEKFRQAIADTEAELAKPRDQRRQYKLGKL